VAALCTENNKRISRVSIIVILTCVEIEGLVALDRTLNSPGGKSGSFVRSECSKMLLYVTEYIEVVFELPSDLFGLSFKGDWNFLQVLPFYHVTLHRCEIDRLQSP
jgi:hypothetical protein